MDEQVGRASRLEDLIGRAGVAGDDDPTARPGRAEHGARLDPRAVGSLDLLPGL